MYLKSQRGTNDFSNSCFSSLQLERPLSRRTDPLLLIYSFQFRSAFRAATTPSQPRPLDTVACVDYAQTTPGQPQIRRPLPSLTLMVLIVVCAFFGTCIRSLSLCCRVSSCSTVMWNSPPKHLRRPFHGSDSFDCLVK